MLYVAWYNLYQFTGHAGNEMANHHMAREAEFMTVIDNSMDTSTGYDKKKLWIHVTQYGQTNGNIYIFRIYFTL